MGAGDEDVSGLKDPPPGKTGQRIAANDSPSVSARLLFPSLRRQFFQQVFQSGALADDGFQFGDRYLKLFFFDHAICQSFSDAFQRLAYFADQVGYGDQFLLETDIGFGEFEGDASGFPFQQIQGLVVVQENAELGQEVRGEVAFSAQPVHQRAVVGPQLLGQEADVVFCLGFHHPADDGSEAVFRHVRTPGIGVVQKCVQFEQ